MAWKVIYHSQEPDDPQVGDLWPEPDYAGSTLVSQRYLKEDRAHRPPLMLMLPCRDFVRGSRFLIDRYSSDDEDEQKGWQVTVPWPLEEGQEVPLHIEPSINCGGGYHGFVREGVISDDCEGRQYPDIRARQAA